MQEIALRLKQIRKINQLSQRQLAVKSGVSNATISQIENNQSTPSISILKKILDVIPISLSDFFNNELPVNNKVFFAQDELTQISDGKLSFLQIGDTFSKQGIQMMYEYYEPGADTGKSSLQHEGEEAGFIIQGHCEITVGEQTRTLGPGDAYRFSSQLPHRFRNTSKQQCVVISACTPPVF